MKPTDRQCFFMPDCELTSIIHSLKREIPAAQALMAAARKEISRRKKAERKQA